MPHLISTELFLVQLLHFNKSTFFCLLLSLGFCCHCCHSCLSAIILKGNQGGETTPHPLDSSTGPLYSLQLIFNSGSSPRQIYKVQILCTAFHSLLYSQDQQQVVFTRKFNKIVAESARAHIFHILFRFYTKILFLHFILNFY